MPVAILLFVLALFGGGTVTYAAQDALPGEPLYSVKRSVEDARTSLTFSQEGRVTLQLSHSQRRLDEAYRLAQQGRVDEARAALSEYERAYEELALALQGLSPEQLEEILGRVDLILEENEQNLAVLRDLLNNLQAEDLEDLQMLATTIRLKATELQAWLDEIRMDGIPPDLPIPTGPPPYPVTIVPTEIWGTVTAIAPTYTALVPTWTAMPSTPMPEPTRITVIAPTLTSVGPTLTAIAPTLTYIAPTLTAIVSTPTPTDVPPTQDIEATLTAFAPTLTAILPTYTALVPTLTAIAPGPGTPYPTLPPQITVVVPPTPTPTPGP